MREKQMSGPVKPESSEDTALQKYLRLYAEPAARSLCLGARELLAEAEAFAAAIVVPAFAEPVACADRLLDSIVSDLPILLILVVNQPLNASAEERCLNQSLLALLSERAERTSALQAGTSLGDDDFCSGLRVHFGLSQRAPRLVVASVDASLPSFHWKAKDGVGRARKLGADLALSLFASRLVIGKYLGSTDMDASLPDGYLEQLTQADDFGTGGQVGARKSPGALLFPYTHETHAEPQTAELMTQVEAKFRYYVLGLAYAGSPYAYHSLGSALGVSFTSYAQVRGFPRRQAGEDFYLLGKIAKLAPLYRVPISNTPRPRVSLLTRLSTRVPFGTGPALRESLARASSGQALVSYHPDTFRALGWLLTRLTTLAATMGEQDTSNQTPTQDSWERWDLKETEWLGELSAQLWSDLSPHLLSLPSAAHRVRSVHESFDALSTLQLIHRATAEGAPMIPVEEGAWALGFSSRVLSPPALVLRLRDLEEGLSPFIGPASEY